MPDLLDDKRKDLSYKGMVQSSRARINPVNLDLVQDGGQFLRTGSISMLGKVTEDSLADDAVAVSKISFAPTSLTASPDAHPETSSVDGWVGRDSFGGESWANIRAVASEAQDSLNLGQVLISGDNISGRWDQVKRSIMTFDLSSMPAGAAILSATLTVISLGGQGGAFGSDAVLCAINSLASETGLVVGDWDNFGSVDFADRVAASAWPTSGDPYTFTLNDAGVTHLGSAAGGIARFGLMISYDIDDIEPTWADATDGIIFSTAEHPTLDAPALTVEYWG